MSDLTTAFRTLKSPPCDAFQQSVDRPAPLTGQVQLVAELSSAERDEMYELLASYFANTSRDQFERDLGEKEWAIVLRDSVEGRICGFSTLMRSDLNLDNQPIVVFFSGDTIIDREYWGETALPKLWGRHVFSLADRIHDARVYWFLICSGYKTYRFLPLFFREFFPTYERPTPPVIRALIDQLGRLKFGEEYDEESGVIRFRAASPLMAGVAEITPQRLKDPHVAFYVNANPGHVNGDELACLAELSRENLTAAGKRMVGQPDERPEER